MYVKFPREEVRSEMKRVSKTNTEGTPVLNGHIEDIKPSMKTQDGVVRKVEDHRKVESQKNPRKTL